MSTWVNLRICNGSARARANSVAGPQGTQELQEPTSVAMDVTVKRKASITLHFAVGGYDETKFQPLPKKWPALLFCPKKSHTRQGVAFTFRVRLPARWVPRDQCSVFSKRLISSSALSLAQP